MKFFHLPYVSNRLGMAAVAMTAVILLMASCGSISQRLADRMKSQEERTVGLQYPKKTKAKKTLADSTHVYSKVRRVDGDSVIWDYENHAQVHSYELGEVTVTAKSRNVVERNGKICIDFVINVPSALIDSRWQLQLQPKVFLLQDSMYLERLFISGADFLKMQQDGLRKYQNFLNSIIPDSAYLDRFFDENGYLGALRKLDDEFYRRWRDEKLDENSFIDWSNRINKRYVIYNNQMYRNRARTEGTASPLQYLPDHWLERLVDKNSTPGKYSRFLDEEYHFERRKLTADDSTLLARKYFDFKARAENERKKEMQGEMYDKLVRFPLQKCRLDTIIDKGDHFEYLYKQDIEANDDYKKILLTMDGQVVAKDESRYVLDPSDTLVFNVSYLTQFADTSVHYKDTIISRYAQANLTAFIQFNKGKTDFIPELADNEREAMKVMEAMKRLTFSGELVMDSINMRAAASPEGSSALNMRLAKGRSQSVVDYVRTHAEDDEASRLLKPRAIGEDWKRLTVLIQQDSHIEHKSEILSLISDIKDEDRREMQIRQYARDYAYMTDSLYPQLRAVNMEFYLHKRDMVQDTIHTTVVDEQYMEALALLLRHRYRDALQILSPYEDYNTALCLLSLGFDHRALEILEKETENANVLYLRSVLLSRTGREKEAVEAFIRCIAMDEQKYWKGTLDPEVNRLIQLYNIELPDEDF